MLSRWSKWILVALGFTWGAYFLLAGRISTVLGDRLSPLLNRVAKGKINDAAVFLQNRVAEVLILLTLAVLLCLLGKAIWNWLGRRELREKWVWQAVALFLLLNVWVGAAMRTAVFWGAMFTGSETANYTQFQFKKNLLRENPAARVALLMGSSQTRSEIDENLMNEQLRGRLWTTELHFPGSAALDLLLTLRRLEEVRGDYIIVYVSEITFYSGIHTEAPPLFARLEDIPSLREVGLKSELFEKSFGYGYLGHVLPLFLAREALTHRILGTGLAQSTQAGQDATLAEDLTERAHVVARRFAMDHTTDIQKKAFTKFLALAAERNRKVILLEGQLNPLVRERMEPKLREDMRGFLREMASRFSNVILVTEDRLPSQLPPDYEDLSHVNQSTQMRFTSWLVDYLRNSPIL